MTTATKAKQACKFSDRVRFNWGFHDGVSAFRNGTKRLDGVTADTIVAHHFDKAYAHGFAAGWYEAAGDASDCEWSASAWNAAVRLGHFAPDRDE